MILTVEKIIGMFRYLYMWGYHTPGFKHFHMCCYGNFILVLITDLVGGRALTCPTTDQEGDKDNLISRACIVFACVVYLHETLTSSAISLP